MTTLGIEGGSLVTDVTFTFKRNKTGDFFRYRERKTGDLCDERVLNPSCVPYRLICPVRLVVLHRDITTNRLAFRYKTL